MKQITTLFLATFLALTASLPAQNGTSPETQKTQLELTSFDGMKFRSLGPALTSGRIADFAVYPDNPKVYFVATASGGVWKTTNAGTTFLPVFDDCGSYSIGCVTIDPNDPNVVWVGTGENNNQRVVGYGDGIYKSADGGQNWKNMGLQNSEHIGGIVVHPQNSDIIYVAAIGPLWSAGGDRGVYKSTDGGQSWKCVLAIDEHTGINEIHMDPADPDILYASAFQRRRHVFTYVGGGPGSGLHRTTDGGDTWQQINKGLPKTDLGRIGLAISPADQKTIYAIVEAARGKGGVYRSKDRGENWERRGAYVTSGNYYQEIIADPVNADKLYAMDTWMKVSTDGGNTFVNVGEVAKHVDNHCMWIDPVDTDHFLVGCDGGIYETWDAARTWDYKANLPVTQFYKVSVDKSEPFYQIYGGTQDNFSLAGPSRSVSSNGISNEEWIITHGGDGFESQADHFNTNIVYTQSQYGVLARFDKLSGEEIGIQPKPRKGENSYRWNWDAPLVASPQKPGRVYFAANKVFKSDDYGNTWDVISDDLTRQVNRNELEVMGRVWEFDAVSKNGSTSPYGTIVAMSESTINPNLLFAGTDDGLIQRSTDGGANWVRFDGNDIPGVPDRTYVNAVVSSIHDENVVYACFNHHKYGDFRPYVYRSSDMGSTWVNISSNLPERGSVYTVIEDHEDPDLLFAGTEFGLFFSPDAGTSWRQLEKGLPVVAVRDIDIHRGQSDLILGTFGRGFYVLDDYSALRSMRDEDLGSDAMLFPVRDALLFEQSLPLGLPGKAFQGDSYWQGENLPSVAIFTYYFRQKLLSAADQRIEAYDEARKDERRVEYPTYEELDTEQSARDPEIWFTIKDSAGKIVGKLSAEPLEGVCRIRWDMRTLPKEPIQLSEPSFYNPFAARDEGTLVPPGTYSVEMSVYENGVESAVSSPQVFEVRALDNAVMPAENRAEMAGFKEEVNNFARVVGASQHAITETRDELRFIRKAISRLERDSEPLLNQVLEIESALRDIDKQINGDRVAATLDIDVPPSVATRIGYISFEQKYSTAEPTNTHRQSLEIAKEEFEPLLARLNKVLNEDLVSLRNALREAGAPYTPGVLPPSRDF